MHLEPLGGLTPTLTRTTLLVRERCVRWSGWFGSRVPRRPRRSVALAPWLVFSVAATGCVRIYQPLSGLHQPVVVDPRVANFQDLHLTVHCVPEDLLSPQAASVLCQKVGTLFENQGAQVETIATVGGLRSDDFDRDPTAGDPAGDDEADEEASEAPSPTDLTLELRARRVHAANNPLLLAFCIGTFTLVPAVSEATFSQDIVIRDGSGFLLASEALEGRLVSYFGVGSWAGNKLLDLVWRDEADKLTGKAFNRDLSSDLYRQLSQLVFNAEMQRRVLREARPGRAD